MQAFLQGTVPCKLVCRRKPANLVCVGNAAELVGRCRRGVLVRVQRQRRIPVGLLDLTGRGVLLHPGGTRLQWQGQPQYSRHWAALAAVKKGGGGRTQCSPQQAVAVLLAAEDLSEAMGAAREAANEDCNKARSHQPGHLPCPATQCRTIQAGSDAWLEFRRYRTLLFYAMATSEE